MWLKTYLLTFGAVQYVTGIYPVTKNYIVSACGSVSLECPIGSLMMVVQASFTEGTECDVENQAQLEDNWAVWNSVVSRCNGYTEGTCLYNLGIELPESRTWGNGRVDVKYRCEKEVSSYCGGKIDVSGPGYISSPGYPKYYLAGRECVWNIYAQLGQTVHLRIMDLSLETEDCLGVLERGEPKMEQCGQVSNTLEFTSKSNQIELRMRTANGRIVPQRGMLVGYRPVGCPAPPTINHGELSVLNSTHVRYVCAEGTIFKSIMASTRIIECRGVDWSETFEDCVSMNKLLRDPNQTFTQALQHLNTFHSRSTRSGDIGIEIGATIMVGVLLVFSLGVAILLYFKFKGLETFYLQDDDEINLKESLSRQVILEEVERY